MKFGILDFNLTVQSYWRKSWNHKALLNIGDAAEYLVMEQLIKSLGVKDSEIVRISIHDLIEYRGEEIIVPLNIAFDSYVGYNKIFEFLSPNIIPVFLGISLTKTDLNDRQLNCLRNYAPIGCRDQRTYNFLQNQKIPCYLNGCTALLLDINNIVLQEENVDKILFIDVPRNVKNYIPENIINDIVFFNQESYCRENDLIEKNPYQWACNILKSYKKPKLIVTSRFHGAVLALAQNIPCILTLEKYTFRFSWLKNYCNIYTEDTFDQIEWNPSRKSCHDVKNVMRQMICKRLRWFYDNYFFSKQLTNFQQVDDDSEKESGNQVLYCHDVIEEISCAWKKDDDIEFGFWGVNDNSNMIYEFISQNYPKARLTDIYDMFQTKIYKGFHSKKPVELRKRAHQDNYYVIVTAYLASRDAMDIFSLVGFNPKKAFLCKREFVEKKHLIFK